MRISRLLGALVLLCPLTAWATACPTGYSNSAAFVVPYQSLNSTLTSFPVLLAFNGITTSLDGLGTKTWFTVNGLKASGSGGQVLSSGNDIVFCDAASGGNLINFERVFWTSTTGGSEFYVSQTLSNTANNFTWMFWGKASDSDHSNAAAVWSAANYSLVQHFGSGGGVVVTDSAGNFTPTNHGTTATAGVAGGGANFVAASSQYIDIGNPVNAVSDHLTAEVWTNPSSTPVGGRLLSNLDTVTTGNGYELALSTPANSVFYQTGGPGSGLNFIDAVSQFIVPGQWAMFVGTSNSGTAAIYVNGSLLVTSGGRDVGTSPLDLDIGRQSGSASLYCDCVEDEIRVSTVTQSPDWINAEYNTYATPNGFALLLDNSQPASMTSGAYCVPVTVNHLQVPNTNQSDFPLLIFGTYKWMADTVNGGFALTGNSGNDILWYADSACTATALDFQKVYWTNTTGESSWRVHVPTVSHTTDTTIYARIGNISDTVSLSANWMGGFNYVAIYNGGSPSALSSADSGSANENAPCSAQVESVYSPVGGGFYFPNGGFSCGWAGSAPGDTLGAKGYPVGSQAGHLRMWAKTTAASNNTTGVNFAGYGKANGSGQRGIQVLYNTGTAASYDYIGMQILTFPSNPAVTFTESTANASTPLFFLDNNWHLYDFDYPTAGGMLSTSSLYIDGVLANPPYYYDGSSTTVLTTDNSPCCTNQAEVRLGRTAAHGVDFFVGLLSQFEVSNVSENSDLINARYNNERAPNTFYSFGTAVPFTSTPPTGQQPIVNVVF